MSALWIVLGMAAVTFLIRYPLLGVSGKLRLSPLVVDILRFVPPAVLSAIIVPAVVFDADGAMDLSPANPRLWGAAAALAAGLWRRDLLSPIIAGMAVFYLVRFTV